MGMVLIQYNLEVMIQITKIIFMVSRKKLFGNANKVYIFVTDCTISLRSDIHILI